MNLSITVLIASALGLLVTAAALNIARREFSKKRREHRMGQALRRGLLEPDGIHNRQARMVQWQACETTTARFS